MRSFMLEEDIAFDSPNYEKKNTVFDLLFAFIPLILLYDYVSSNI